MSLKFLSNIVVSFILVCLLASQFPFVLSQASADEKVPASSSFILKQYLNLIGVKAGSFGLYLSGDTPQNVAYENNDKTKQSSTQKNTKLFSLPFLPNLPETKPQANSLIVSDSSSSQSNNQSSASTPTLAPTNEPTVEPTATPIPAAQSGNLVQNPSFEDISDGWANGWTKDTIDFYINNSSTGNDGNNSLSVAAVGVNAHVWSNRIAVDSNSTYTWSQYVNTTYTGEEFGFYVDEYDVNDTWISGQWMGRLPNDGSFHTGITAFTYTPSNENVKSVRLQYYSVRGNTAVIHIDSVYFGK